MSDLKITPFLVDDIDGVKKLTDIEIGENYFSLSELEEIQKKSYFKNQTASFVLRNKKSIFGVRLSLPPGQWQSGKGEILSEDLWEYKKDETAYFQSLFVSKSMQKKAWGKRLSEKSIEVLRSMGAKAIVCHSWLESPGGASKKYLLSLGFRSLAVYPEYWKNVDYICPRCGKPCVCSAEEMYMKIRGS